MNKTLLDITPERRLELDRQRTRRDEQHEKVSAVLALLMGEYADGGLAFRTLCQRMESAIATMKEEPPSNRTSLLGQAVATALKLQPKKKRGRSRTPLLLIEAAAKMVKMAQKDGLKATREPNQAFDKVATLLRSAGYTAVTISAVEKWFYQRNPQNSNFMA